MAKSSTPKADYQTLNDELDMILADLQRDDLDVDQAIDKYRRGLELVKKLEIYLETAENTVNELRPRSEKDDV